MAGASSAPSAMVTSGAKRVPPADTGAPGRSNTTNPGTEPSSMTSGSPKSLRTSGSRRMPSPMVRPGTRYQQSLPQPASGRAGEGRAGEGRAGEGRAGEGRPSEGGASDGMGGPG